MTNLLDQAGNAAQYDDQTETKAFERTVAPEGYTTARFIGYVEIGKQPQRPYQGVDKPDAAEVRLTFELNGPKHITEYEKDGVKMTRTNIHREKLTISSSEKSNFQKLFKKMLAGRTDIKHMAQLLGEGFLVKIKHNLSKDGKNTYANIKVDGVWDIGAPSVTDPITNETTILDVPEATHAVQLLLWSNPSKEQWDSIFIDGTYTKNDGKGQDIEVSKNFIQNEAMAASNFIGSPLEALVAGIGVPIKEDLAPNPAPTPKAETTTEQKGGENVPSTAEEDPLAALGL